MGTKVPEVVVAVGGDPGGPGVRTCGPLGKIDPPMQVGSPGPNRLKVTAPVGLGPPVTPVIVAMSEMGLPIWVTPVATVVMVGVAAGTVRTDTLLLAPELPVVVLAPEA